MASSFVLVASPPPPSPPIALCDSLAKRAQAILSKTPVSSPLPIVKETEPKKELKRTRSVGFEGADIVEFEPTIFTTTVTSGGVPVGLSNKERRRIRRRLDSFELERQKVRVCRQNYMEEGYLDPQERAVILGNAGCEETSFESVEAEVNMIIAHRRESNEMDIQCMYGLGEYGDSDSEDDTAGRQTADEGIQSPTPLYGACLGCDDTTEWKQTLDMIAKGGDMEPEGEDGLSKARRAAIGCDDLKDDDSLFFLSSGENFAEFELNVSCDMDDDNGDASAVVVPTAKSPLACAEIEMDSTTPDDDEAKEEA
ncbi:hypothetical protein SDRG_15548 [Saprolegnia diclina VS20]|uniref:Uncharacterized protein n=1 Tax=Saprolegnia diclina (strain VS20) TaxID=1156394 RepID=T0R3H7_SAPDV|nr:hypothetical protein SDRG_15548 [Saprolegnia diclina VS20]EQC26608.1 hypothetical protein SDRG_15548 [Saprolegnia diclina VS20]|eukprot:XP_008619946.1 hypothetical protein SDRG_15548 [Saprolegnia diclina VS20]